MVTGTQVEEVPRTLISLDIPLTAAIYWVRVGGECPRHTVDVFQFCSWDRLLPFSGFSCWHCDFASAHLWPASDAPFLSTSFLGLSTFTKCPCFTRSQVSGSTFPSLRTIQSNPWSWEPWTRSLLAKPSPRWWWVRTRSREHTPVLPGAHSGTFFNLD